VDSVTMDEKQIPGAVLEELRKLNNFMKSIQMDINAIKMVVETRGMTVHVSGITEVVQAVEKLASRFR